MFASWYQQIGWMLCCAALLCTPVWAQSANDAPANLRGAAPADDAGMVSLNFPENVSLKVLVDYVGTRQGINFIYDASLAGRTVTIKAPKAIPADSLISLLGSILKANNFVLSPTSVPGTMRIEAATQLATLPGTLQTSDQSAVQKVKPTLVMTRVVKLKNAGVAHVVQVLQPFMTQNVSSVVPLPEHNMLIVTDYADNMTRLEQLIALADQPGREVEVKFLPINYAEASDVAQQLTQLLMGKIKARGLAADSKTSNMSIIVNQRTNQLALVGQPDEIKQAIALVNSLDASLGMATKVYNFKMVTADQVDRLVKKLIGEVDAKRYYKSATDKDMNLLIATTTPDIHAQIETLKQSLDKPVAESQSPIRFYKLQNAKASDVLDTLQSIEGDSGLNSVSVDGVTGQPSATAAAASVADTSKINGPTPDQVNDMVPPGSATGNSQSATSRRKAIQLRNARVMADEPSNTIIVVATPAMQNLYEKLIERLDVRRPQVLIEATVISIDTTDGFRLGVQISKNGSFNNGEAQTITFSNFGLSTDDDLATGGFTLSPGLGFNGAIISTDIANVIVRALESDKHVKVISRPSVLINDNAEGVLDSVNKVPYSSINSTNTGLDTISLGGYVEAGTKVNITPQISEGDHLKLTYSIELSSFGDSPNEALPPTQLKNSLKSEVTIPDGYTIIVGGLKQQQLTETIDRIPLLGHIPLLEYLFSNRSTDDRQSTLFVFIHAAVLREDKFEDLKTLSDEAAIAADLSTHFPTSEPVEVR